jgi:hypothetical protein
MLAAFLKVDNELVLYYSIQTTKRMLNVTVFILLMGIISINYVALSKFKINTLSLRNSILFFINAVFVVILISWSINLSSNDNASHSSSLDTIIAFQSAAVSVRNTLVLASLLYLAYGTSIEYLSKKKMPILLIAIFLFTISILFFAACLLTGSFIL